MNLSCKITLLFRSIDGVVGIKLSYPRPPLAKMRSLLHGGWPHFLDQIAHIRHVEKVDECQFLQRWLANIRQ